MKNWLLALAVIVIALGSAIAYTLFNSPAQQSLSMANTSVQNTNAQLTQVVAPQTTLVTAPKNTLANAMPQTTLATVSLKSNPLTDINVNKLISVAAADGLNPKVLKAALNSYAWALEHNDVGSNNHTLTVIDFTLPSYVQRMWVLDLNTDTVLMKLYTTHGKNSGQAYATQFSNKPSSDETSLGVYVTSDEYYGKHDKSMQINGLEKGVNDNARARSIVIHSAPYAAPQYIQSHHQAGRSWGCFAVDPAVKDQLLDDVKGGSVIFAYASAEDHDPVVSNGPI